MTDTLTTEVTEAIDLINQLDGIVDAYVVVKHGFDPVDLEDPATRVALKYGALLAFTADPDTFRLVLDQILAHTQEARDAARS